MVSQLITGKKVIKILKNQCKHIIHKSNIQLTFGNANDLHKLYVRCKLGIALYKICSYNYGQ